MAEERNSIIQHKGIVLVLFAKYLRRGLCPHCGGAVAATIITTTTDAFGPGCLYSIANKKQPRDVHHCRGGNENVPRTHVAACTPELQILATCLRRTAELNDNDDDALKVFELGRLGPVAFDF